MQAIPAPMPLPFTEERVEQARKIVTEHQRGSVSLVQRELRCRYFEAATLLEELERRGVVGPMNERGGRPVLVAV